MVTDDDRLQLAHCPPLYQFVALKAASLRAVRLKWQMLVLFHPNKLLEIGKHLSSCPSYYVYHHVLSASFSVVLG